MRNRRSRWHAIATVLLSTTACTADPVSTGIDHQPSLTVEPAAVGWATLSTAGSGPSTVNASAHAPELQAVFAAFMPDFGVGSLWRFDLRTDTWTPLPANNWPDGKYRNLVYDPRNRRIMTYWNGLGQVYAIPETGGAWTPVGSAPNSDEYYEGYSFFNPVTRRLTLFAGYGFGSWKDILWEWNEAGNQWESAAQSAPRPEPRFGHGPSTVAVDAAGKRAFLGQRSHGMQPGNYDDLWSIDLRTNTWRNLIPAYTGATSRIGSALAFVARTKTLFRFGGCPTVQAFDPCVTTFNGLDSAQPDKPLVRWTRVKVTGAIPSPRVHGGFFYDGPRNRLVLVSGINTSGWQDDVWAYKLP